MNTGTTSLHSASEARRSTELELAQQLYALISSGCDNLAFSVSAGGPMVIERNPKAKDPADRFRVLEVLGKGPGAPPWVRAKERRDGVEFDRHLNPWVLAKHIRGNYSVAVTAAGWVAWIGIDIDAHRRPGESELEARRRAKRTLGRVLAAFGCSATRHPLILRSPGGGYHVWLPLTREGTSANAEHTWPTRIVRRWFTWHLEQAGLDLAPGVIEVFPSGRCLRVPCGRGMVLLKAMQPDNPDALGLVPWPGTAQVLTDWSGEGDEIAGYERLIAPMARAFIEQWAAQRRTPSDWLGRSDASWDAQWGCLGWREGNDIPRWREIFLGEKNAASAGPGQSASQQIDDVSGCPQAGDPRPVQARKGGGGLNANGTGRESVSPINETTLLPSAAEVDSSPASAGELLVRGRAYFDKVTRLLREGITGPGLRHDATLTLAFYWAGTCGLPAEEALDELEKWCRKHPHQGSSTMQESPRAFVRECLYEARHYIEHYASLWPFRGRGGRAGAMGTLTSADRVVVEAAEPKVAKEVATILAWLAGRADANGRVLDPVQIAHGLLKRLCGDRRVDVDGDGTRRRAVTVAIAELERIGVLTLDRNYRVGKRGRIWSCWYRFGSGELARSVVVPAAKWEEIAPFRRRRLVPTPAMLEIVPSTPEGAPTAPVVEVLVLGEKRLSEGLLSALSNGARGLARTRFSPAPGVENPIAGPPALTPWFEHHYQMVPLTPRRLWAANAAAVIEDRRDLARSDRVDLGGGGRDRTRRPGAPVVTHPEPCNGSSSALSNASPAAAQPARSGQASGSGSSIATPTSPASAPSESITPAAPQTPVAPAAPQTPVAPAAPQTPVAPQTPQTPAAPQTPQQAIGSSADAAEAALLSTARDNVRSAGERSEAALRAQLAEVTDAAFAAACSVYNLEYLCRTWRNYEARSNSRGQGRGS